MSRRTKSDLIQAEKRRLKRVKKIIKSKKTNYKTEAGRFQNEVASVKKNQEPAVAELFQMSFGYSLDLIKKDLFKTVAATGFVIAALLAVYIFQF